MPPRPDVSEERRNQILDAAQEVFSRQGFHQSRMDDIVEESGLSKGTLYWYFKSKDEIFNALLAEIFNRELSRLSLLQEAEGSSSQKLMKFTQYAIQDFQRLLRLRPIVYEFYAIALRNKTLRDSLKVYFRHYVAMIVPIIQQGIDRGEFRPVDPLAASLAVGAVIEGTILLWIYDEETVDWEQNMQTSIQLLLDGLRVNS